MPLLRCRWYDDNGNSISGGCRFQGSSCEFVHPSEPTWFKVGRKVPPADPAGPPPARGGGRGRGGGSRGGFQGRAAPAPAPVATGWGTEATSWGPAEATSSWGASETTSSWGASETTSGWGASETAAPAQEKTDAWSGWGSAGATWDATGTGGADLGKGKGKEKEASSGWGSAAGAGSGWGTTTSGWGDEGGDAGGKSTGWGDQKAAASESKPKSKTNVEASSGKTSEKAKEKERWAASYNGGWGTMSPPSAGGWGASTSWGTEGGADADGNATMQDQDAGKEEGEVQEGADATMQDVPSEEATEDEDEDHAWQQPPQTWTEISSGLGDASVDANMGAQAPTRAGIQEPDPSRKSQADRGASAHIPPIAVPASAMDVDRKQRESSATPFDSDVGRYAPESLPGRRDACKNQIKAMAHAVQLYMRLQKEEEELAKYKRMQISKNYERVGRSGQDILNAKRKVFQDRVNASRKEYETYINKLAGYPSLESILMGFDPDMEMRSALDYLGQIKEWTAAVQPSVEHIVDQEAKAQEQKRQRSPDEPDYIPASIRPIYQQLRTLEEQTAAMQAELEYRVDQTPDLVDQRIEERKPELVAAFAQAQLAAQDEALRAPFDALNQRLTAVGAGIEEQANRFAPLMNNAAQQDISHIEAEHEDLKAKVSQIEACTAQTHADMQAELARSRALRAQLDAAPNPHVARTLSADEMMRLLEPELRRFVRGDITLTAEMVERRYRAYIEEHQEMLYGAVWTRLQPTMMLVDTAQTWMDKMMVAMEEADAKRGVE